MNCRWLTKRKLTAPKNGGLLRACARAIYSCASDFRIARPKQTAFCLVSGRFRDHNPHTMLSELAETLPGIGKIPDIRLLEEVW